MGRRICQGAPVAAARAALRTSALCANDRQCLRDVTGSSGKKILEKTVGCDKIGFELQPFEPFPFLNLSLSPLSGGQFLKDTVPLSSAFYHQAPFASHTKRYNISTSDCSRSASRPYPRQLTK